jgi:hypothetical protein
VPLPIQQMQQSPQRRLGARVGTYWLSFLGDVNRWVSRKDETHPTVAAHAKNPIAGKPEIGVQFASFNSRPV